MKKNLRWLALSLAVLMMVSLVTACGQSQGSPDSTSTASGGKTVLRVARPEDISYWDQLDNFNLVNWSVGRLLYDQLIRRNQDGSYSPHLATEWELIDGGKSFRFTLREDVTFSNGETLDANDVKFTVERFLTENLRQAANWTNLEGVEITGDYSGIIKFSKPNGAILSILSELAILPKETYEEQRNEKFFQNPIGSGPYKFKSWTQGALIVFEKNESYWGEPGVSDVIEYHTIIDDTTRVSAFMAGDVDWADNIPADQIAMIEGENNVVERIKTWDAIYLGLKCDTAPFDDVNVRKAINLAIDRQAIVNSILSGGTPSNWVVSEGVLGYNPDAPEQKQDLEEAKRLMAASGYDGREISLVGPTTWYARTSEVTQYIASCLTEIGFNVKIELIDGATFSDRRAGGDYDIYYTGCSHVGGDPILYLNQRIHDDTMASGYVNPAIKAKIEEALTVTDLEARDQIFKEIFQMIMDANAPHLYVYGIENVVVKRSNVQGDIVYQDKIIDFSHAYVS